MGRFMRTDCRWSKTLGALFEGIVAEWVEKNLAQRTGDWFAQWLPGVMTLIAKSGSVDVAPFPRSPEYAACKARLRSHS